MSEQAQSSTPGADSSHPEPKKSHTVLIWTVILAVVLSVLAIEMGGEKIPGFNVIISMTGDVCNCEIVVDGAVRGQFHPNQENDSHTMWLKLTDGKHKIEIRKDGRIIQPEQEFEVKGKQFLRFDSGSPSQSN